MSTIQIFGSLSLEGEIEVQGAKNAVLPIMAGALLYEGVSVISNVPRIRDVFCMIHILEGLGCRVELSGNELTIDASDLTGVEILKEYVDKMRSSIMVLGALIGRMGEAVTYYPGGCSIGERPIDLHVYVLERLGVQIEDKDFKISAAAKKLEGNHILLRFPSVGATENAILASVRANGITRIQNAAREPEIIELCEFLVQMGACIQGIGTSCLSIIGRRKLHGTHFQIGGDRIVAGTYLAAGVATKGNVTVKGISSIYMDSVLNEFMKMGADVTKHSREITVSMKKRPKSITALKTEPYPKFPTDMQSQIMAVLTLSDGVSIIEESIFEGRFETVKELKKMGAEILVSGSTAQITGVDTMYGACVEAKDLRGGAALVVAALCADGVSTISDCCHILRGYEDICEDLRSLGGRIEYQE